MIGAGLESPSWWLGLAALGALLAMDEHGLAQTWFSQPLPACLLGGLLAGDPRAGLAAGIMLQLAVIGNLPVGATYRLDTVSAGVGVTAGAVASGWLAPSLPALWASPPGPDAQRLGWLLVLMALAGLLGGRAVHLERRACLGRMLGGYRSVRDGDLVLLEKLHDRCLLVTGLRGALLTCAWALATAAIWRLAFSPLPDIVRQSLGLLPYLVPLLAVGSLLERYGHRHALPLVAAGAATGFVLLRFVF